MWGLRPDHFPDSLVSKSEGLQFSRIQVKQINSAQRIFGLKLRIGDLFAVGGPCQRTSENSEGSNVEHLLIRAIEVCCQQTVLASFGIVATDVGHAPVVGGKCDRTVYVADHHLRSASQYG